MQIKINAPEKKSQNFFVKMKPTKVKWIKQEALKKEVSMSQYMDLLLDEIMKKREK